MTLLQVLKDLFVRDAECLGLEFRTALDLASGMPPLHLVLHQLGMRSPSFFSQGNYEGTPATFDHLAHGRMIPLIRKSAGVFMQSTSAI